MASFSTRVKLLSPLKIELDHILLNAYSIHATCVEFYANDELITEIPIINNYVSESFISDVDMVKKQYFYRIKILEKYYDYKILTQNITRDDLKNAYKIFLKKDDHVIESKKNDNTRDTKEPILSLKEYLDALLDSCEDRCYKIILVTLYNDGYKEIDKYNLNGNTIENNKEDEINKINIKFNTYLNKKIINEINIYSNTLLGSSEEITKILQIKE